jgi:hypothetical protein
VGELHLRQSGEFAVATQVLGKARVGRGHAYDCLAMQTKCRQTAVVIGAR